MSEKNLSQNFTRLKLWDIEELKDERAKQIFQSFIDKQGFVPNWARVMANDPEILVAFVQLMKVTMAPGSVGAKLKWIIANEVSDLNKCTYCVGVTEAMLESLGAEKDLLEKIETHDGLSEAELAALEYAKLVTTEAYKVPDNTFDKLEDHFSDEQILEITAVIGLFNYINRFNDALRVLPEKA